LSVGAMQVFWSKGILRVNAVYMRLEKPVKSLSGECKCRMETPSITRSKRGSSMERIETFRTFLMEE
jgi:hypothetical protein